MPIFEFKCTECGEFFELLVMNQKDDEEVKCPKCGAQSFERVMSMSNYSMGGSSAGTASKPSCQERSCSGGSCSTYSVPGIE